MSCSVRARQGDNASSAVYVGYRVDREPWTEHLGVGLDRHGNLSVAEKTPNTHG